MQKTAIINRVKSWLAQNPVILDTETTGFKGEVIELALIDRGGATLMNTLIRPTVAVEPDAARVHGLTNADLVNAPTFAEVYPVLLPLLQGRLVIIYNAQFDTARLRHTAAEFGLDWPALSAVCAMEIYARFYGEWNRKTNDYRWQSLSNAARQCGLEVPENLHRAAADAELTRRLLLHIAELGD